MLQCEACRLRFYRLVEIQRQSVKNWTIVNADELIKSITGIKQSNQQSSAIWNRVIFEFQGCIPIIIPFFSRYKQSQTFFQFNAFNVEDQHETMRNSEEILIKLEYKSYS